MKAKKKIIICCNSKEGPAIKKQLKELITSHTQADAQILSNNSQIQLMERLEQKVTSLEQQNEDFDKIPLSYTFDGYESLMEGEHPKECYHFKDDIFEEINEFELSSFNNIGVFESLIFAINQIENNKKNKNKKYSPLINIVLSGERFPYYSSALEDKVRTSIYEKYIIFIYAKKIKFQNFLKI